MLVSVISDRKCELCLAGWVHHQSNCYEFNDPDTAGQKTWEEARENCRGKNSDLAVIVNEDEKVMRKLWEFYDGLYEMKLYFLSLWATVCLFKFSV